MILPVVMAGGVGSRLWPLSRELMPKQFLALEEDTSMLQHTLLRLQGMQLEHPLLICHEDHRFIAAEQLRQINQLSHNILLEPAGRNTGPAVALAAFVALQQQQDPLLLILASDHWIASPALLQQAILSAVPFAQSGQLVTFGIAPTTAETGYGYIKAGVLQHCGGNSAYQVERFVEKPQQELAQQYLETGQYYWNSGMFLFRASRYLQELNQHRPDIYAACERATAEISTDLDFIRVNAEAFLSCPSESVDYAVMEHTRSSVMIPLQTGWNDLGSWSSLWQVAAKDTDGNVHKGDVLSLDSANNYVFAESAVVATLGLNDLVVVQTKDAVLVADRQKVQDVKALVQQLKAQGRTEHQTHRQVYRPWGKAESLAQGARHQVKHLTVLPGQKLSVQKHQHRAEHWIVVAGTAVASIDGIQTVLTENQSIYVPLGAIHSLENPGDTLLELIEVQSGLYLGEDDIVRFADRYGRADVKPD